MKTKLKYHKLTINEQIDKHTELLETMKNMYDYINKKNTDNKIFEQLINLVENMAVGIHALKDRNNKNKVYGGIYGMSLNELDISDIKWDNMDSVSVIQKFIVDSINVRNDKSSYLDINHSKLIVIHDAVLNMLKEGETYRFIISYYLVIY